MKNFSCNNFRRESEVRREYCFMYLINFYFARFLDLFSLAVATSIFKILQFKLN